MEKGDYDKSSVLIHEVINVTCAHDMFMFSVLNSVEDRCAETVQYSITTPENIGVLIVYENRLFWWFVDILDV